MGTWAWTWAFSTFCKHLFFAPQLLIFKTSSWTEEISSRKNEHVLLRIVSIDRASTRTIRLLILGYSKYEVFFAHF